MKYLFISKYCFDYDEYSSSYFVSTYFRHRQYIFYEYYTFSEPIDSSLCLWNFSSNLSSP